LLFFFEGGAGFFFFFLSSPDESESESEDEDESDEDESDEESESEEDLCGRDAVRGRGVRRRVAQRQAAKIGSIDSRQLGSTSRPWLAAAA
jgi:hypothetical protein